MTIIIISPIFTWFSTLEFYFKLALNSTVGLAYYRLYVTWIWFIHIIFIYTNNMPILKYKFFFISLNSTVGYAYYRFYVTPICFLHISFIYRNSMPILKYKFSVISSFFNLLINTYWFAYFPSSVDYVREFDKALFKINKTPHNL